MKKSHCTSSLVTVGCFLIMFSGCIPGKPDLVEVRAEIVSVKEADHNSAAQFSEGVYQQFFTVEMNVYEPDELAGKTFLVNMETGISGGQAKLLKPRTKLEFFVDPRLLNKNKPSPMSEMHGYIILPD